MPLFIIVCWFLVVDIMEFDYKFIVEYAKSGRSSCNKCKMTIGQDSLRMGRLVQAPNFDGKIPRWCHFRCFWLTKVKIESTTEIKNFDSIRWDDQEKIKSSMGSDDSVPTVKCSVKLSVADIDCKDCAKPLMQVCFCLMCFH